MTSDTSTDDGPTSPAEFERSLGRVLLAALEQDVDPRGSWVYRTAGTVPDLEVMVHELDDREPTD